jgi:hypothetical protein
MAFKVGDTVYLKAADSVFDACSNRYVARARSGPLMVENVYVCGNHWRVKASIPGSTYGYYDSAMDSFELA